MKKIVAVIVVLFLCLPGSSQERLFKYRGLSSVGVKLSELSSIKVFELHYYTPKTGHTSLSLYGDFTEEFKVAKWLKAGVKGRLVSIKGYDGWRLEQRPMVYGNITKPLGDVQVKFNNRMEYMIAKKRDNYFRHRQALSVELPFYYLTWLKLFATEESFYCFNAEKLNRGRLSSGTIIQCNNYLQMKVFYMFDKKKTDNLWQNSDLFSLQLYVDF